MVTRKDVAQKAGVSPATVSHVINGTKYVSSELREKVEEAVRILNYKPNIIARGLATKVTKHVGILVNDITNPYYGEIAQGMEEVASKNGYIVSIYFASGDVDEYFSTIIQRQLDGLFIATIRTDFSKEQLASLYDAGVIVVNGLADRGPKIDFDYVKAVDDAIRYLADMGHTRIGFLSGLPLHQEHIRFVAYKDAIKKYDLEYDPQMIIDGIYPYETTHRTGYEAMKELLSSGTRVTAVLTTNDLMAIGAVKAVKEAGLEIPGDISIVGCDDIFLTECIDPPITTLRAPKKEMGRQAMHLILNQINEKKCASIMLDMSLVIRGSTGRVKKG